MRKLACTSGLLLNSSAHLSRISCATTSTQITFIQGRDIAADQSIDPVGALVEFKIKSSIPDLKLLQAVELFTGRPDTIFGAIFLALSLNHPLVLAAAQHDHCLQSFLENRVAKKIYGPTYILKGIYAFNPIREVRSMAAFPAHESRKYIYKPMPILVAAYVGMSSPTRGSVMGVPAHDERDHWAWRQHMRTNSIPSVISPVQKGDKDFPLNRVKFLTPQIGDTPFTEKGRLNALCGLFAGVSSDDAIKLLPQRVPGMKLVRCQTPKAL